MDGLLVIDKPVGPTSHDVVARVRKVVGERRIGHTGTLDPLASGVLPLVVGRATRLARFLSAAEKSYEAVLRLGIETDSYDGTGRPVGAPHTGPHPSREAIEGALETFRGSFLQQPPAFSAKKIDGRRSYRLARSRARHADLPADPALPADPDLPADRGLPAPVRVTAHAIELVSICGQRVTVRLDCSAGFYVRSLAHDLGRRLGTGAHLAELRRTRSGDVTLKEAIELEAAERDPGAAAAHVIPLRGLLPGLPAVVLTQSGVRHAVQGRDLGPADAVAQDSDGGGFNPVSDLVSVPLFRLFDPEGELVGLAGRARTPGLLHPSVILM
jgi:tRNA pseudouridine55 synthase